MRSLVLRAGWFFDARRWYGRTCACQAVAMRRVLLAIAVAKIAGIAVYASVLRTRQLQWGAARGEPGATLPGDELIPAADLSATRAITIAAAPELVWPWLAQLGQGRGGFYSYDRLENLAGCEVRSADAVVPDWQDVAPGDEFRLHPKVCLRVAIVQPERALVVAGITAPDADPEQPAAPYDFTWAFVIAEAGPGQTRLLVRERYRYRSPWAAAAVEVVSLLSFVMTQRMLRGIRERSMQGP